jgi:farnesol dehydrogenase
VKLLVTGGTGFLGRALTARLAREHSVRLLVRRGASRERFPTGVEFAEGDVTDRASLDRAAAGRDALVHAAALVKIDAPAAEFDRVNVRGLENVLAAASASGVERVLYVSSFIALGPTEAAPGGVLDEGAEPRLEERSAAWINDYERTKTLADVAARRAIERGAPLVVVYPGVIYGPGELTEGNILVRHLLDLAHGRLPALLGRPERRWNYAYVADVAAGIVAALERAPRGARYVLGGENVRQDELYARVAELGGVRVPARRMSDRLARTAGWAMKGWARLTGGVPRLTPDLVEIYRHDWAYDSSRAVRELGYAPRSLAEGLERTFDWLRTLPEWPARLARPAE